jgi:hypothetical protein
VRKVSWLALAITAAAALTISEWQYRRPIAAPAAPGLAALTLDPVIYSHSMPGSADLRVVRSGDEVPYVLQTMRSEVREIAVPATVLDRGSNANSLELTLDTGRTDKHNRLEILTNEHNFRQKVRLEASDNRSRWYTLREEAWIVDFSEEGRSLRSTEIEYPTSTRRYLRITIDGWTAKQDTSAARVFFSDKASTRYQELARYTKASLGNEDEKCRCSVIDLHPAAGLPVERITFETSAPYFYRAVDVQSSSDEKTWSWIGSGAIFRLPGDERLSLDIPLTTQPHLRVRVYNQDDKPLPFATAVLYGLERRVVFQHDAKSEYFLYYGREKTTAPSYDFSQLVARTETSAAALTFGPEQKNPSYQLPPPPAKPLSEQYQNALYVIVAIAAIALGYISFRFLRSASGAAPPEA